MAGGGTGGHISPVLAVCDELKKIDPDVDLSYVGTSSGLERKIVQAHGLNFYAISAGKYRRYNRGLLKSLLDIKTVTLNAKDLIRFINGIFQSYKLISKLKPHIIFIKGGFVGLPVGLAAKLLRVAYIIHESDAVFGLTNKLLSKSAAKIATMFPEDAIKADIDKHKLVRTGIPIREAFLNPDPQRFFKTAGLAEGPIITVVGGSQGSHNINTLIEQSLEQLLNKFAVVHVTGEREKAHFDSLKQNLSSELAGKYYPYGFLGQEIADIFAASDLIVSRAGATFITEISTIGRPLILIPLTTSAGGHQDVNARILGRNRAAILLDERRLTAEKLVEQIDQVVTSPELSAELVANQAQFASRNATRKLAELVFNEGLENVR